MNLKTEADELVLRALRFYQSQGRYDSIEAGKLERLIMRLEEK